MAVKSVNINNDPINDRDFEMKYHFELLPKMFIFNIY